MELKIQTRIWHCGSMGLLIKGRTLPFIWLHLEEHATTCPFDWVQQDEWETPPDQWLEKISLWGIIERHSTSEMETASNHKIAMDDLGIPCCPESIHTALVT